MYFLRFSILLVIVACGIANAKLRCGKHRPFQYPPSKGKLYKFYGFGLINKIGTHGQATGPMEAYIVRESSNGKKSKTLCYRTAKGIAKQRGEAKYISCKTESYGHYMQVRGIGGRVLYFCELIVYAEVYKKPVPKKTVTKPGACLLGFRVNNAKVPFMKSFRGGMVNHRDVIAEGRVNSNARRFTLNLYYNKAIMLHFDVRYGGKPVVVFNSHFGRWGREERVANPFKKGSTFRIIVKITQTQYVIYVNKRKIHAYNFRHVNDVKRINRVGFTGHVRLSRISVSCLNNRSGKGCKYRGSLLRSPKVPFTSKTFQGGMVKGRVAEVRGKVNSNAKRFTLDFYYNKVIMLHYDVRYFTTDHIIVLNSMFGKWGREERVKNPFKKGSAFTMKVVATNTHYLIYANRRRIHSYKIRKPGDARKINLINLYGDVSVSLFTVNCLH